MKKLFYLFALGVILLPACSADINVTTPDNEEFKINANVDAEDVNVNLSEELKEQLNDLQDQSEESLITYTDSTLGISFQYPKAWGTIEVTQDKVGPVTGYALAFSEGTRFLNAGDANPDGDHGAGWLDWYGTNEVTPEMIASHCETVDLDASDSCEVFSTDHGIQMVKYTHSIYEQPQEDVYAFYNPNNLEFPAVILGSSGVVLKSASNEVQKAQFEALINSIRLQ